MDQLFNMAVSTNGFYAMELMSSLCSLSYQNNKSIETLIS